MTVPGGARATHTRLLFGGAAACAVLAAAFAAPSMLSDRGPHARGERLAASGDPEAALALWEAACDAEPPDAKSCAAAGFVRLDAGEAEAAADALRRGKAADPEQLQVMLLEGEIHEKEGRVEDARVAYAAARRRHPESARPLVALAVLEGGQGNLPDAETLTEEAVLLEPGSAVAHAVRGRHLAAAGDVERAIEAYARAVDLDPAWVEARVELADLFGRRGAFGASLEHLQVASSRRPRDPRIAVALGSTLGALGRYDEAFTELRRAAELDPDALVPQLALGEAYLRSGRAEFAEARFRLVLEREPAHVEARRLRAAALAEMGRSAEAVEVLDRLLEGKALSADERVEALLQRAYLHFRDRRDDAAFADAVSLLALRPGHPEASWLAGHLDLEAKRYEAAKPRILAALRDPAPEVLLDHARLLAHAGRLDEALAELETLAVMGALDVARVRAQSEFEPLAERREYRLLLEGVVPGDDASRGQASGTGENGP